MTLSRLELHQFRSHHDNSFSFSPGVNSITGKNASGKTNILEAIYVLATGKSFRDSDSDLTEYDCNWWKIIGTFGGVKREARYYNGVKTFIIDGNEYKRLPVKKYIPTVLFEPDDLFLVHGQPAKRRAYIDMTVGIVTPGYKTVLKRFERALAQRNRLLKSNTAVDHDMLFVWDMMLAEQAAIIVDHRRKIVDVWNKRLGYLYQNIVPGETTITVEYKSNLPTTTYKQSLLHALKSSVDHDTITGSTRYGPHRDDIVFYRDGKDCVTSASRGEVRSLLLALKKNEAELLEMFHQTAPLLLWDDVLSELDISRHSALINSHMGSQLIITSTDWHADHSAHHISL